MKKLILTLFLIFGLASSSFAYSNLWDYYTKTQGNFPSLFERQIDAKNAGIDNYTGTFAQNVALLSHLTGNMRLGGFAPSGGGTYRLQSSIGLSDTSITLSSFKEPVSGTAYTMTYLNTSIAYGTLDPQQPTRSEFISFTGITQNADGTATLTGVTRGLAKSYPFTSSSTYKVAHAGQSIFILSDAPGLFNEYAIKRNNETITGDWNFTGQATFSVFPITPSNSTSSETVAGIVEIATQIEAASSTVNGTLSRLVIPASIATSSYNAATAPLRVVVTDNNGKIDQNFFKSTTTAVYEFSSSTYIGDLQAWSIGKNSTVVTTTGSSTVSIPSGINKVKVTLCGAGGGGGGVTDAGRAAGGGGAGGCAVEFVDVSATTSVNVFVGSGGAGGTSGSSWTGGTGGWTTFGTNGFYLYAFGGSGGTEIALGGAGGTASGGDINITGKSGNAGHDTLTANIPSGSGGDSLLGFGGSSRVGAADVVGQAAVGYGGGGSGAFDVVGGTSPDSVGGAGSQGIIIMEW